MLLNVVLTLCLFGGVLVACLAIIEVVLLVTSRRRARKLESQTRASAERFVDPFAPRED